MHMELNRAKWTGRTSLLGNVNHSHSFFLKYSMVHSRLIPKKQSTIGFSRLSNPPPLKMQCPHDIQEDFTWIVTWIKELREMK